MVQYLHVVMVAVCVGCGGGREAPLGVQGSSVNEGLTVGRLHIALGTRVVVRGVVIEGPLKGYDDGPNLRVQAINGQMTQELVRLPLALDNPAKFAWAERDTSDRYDHVGKSYEIEGYENSRVVGLSEEELNGPIKRQGAGRHAIIEFVATTVRGIEQVVISPTDFAGREALLEGIAQTSPGQARIAGASWSLSIDGMSAWAGDVEGKLVETLGTIRKDAETGAWMSSGTWRLVRLEDQIGRTVELRGRAHVLNNLWWFSYRGTSIHVDGMGKLPGLSEYGSSDIVIRGTLDQAMLPRIDQFTWRKEPELRLQFIVRDARWEPVEALLSPEVSSGDF